MTAVSKWVAAGSSAAVLAGGLLLGAPMATAAPGDAACLQASTQFEAALGAAGITEGSVAQIDATSQAAATAQAAYAVLVEAAGADESAAVGEAIDDLEAARAAADAAEAAAEDAEDSGDPAAIAATTAAADEAEAAVDSAEQTLQDRQDAYNAAIDTPEIREAQGALEAAVRDFETALAAVSLDEASAADLTGLFEAFLAACDGTGVDPVVAPPGRTTPVVTSPVVAAPAGAGTANTAVVATNKGLNVQTAATAEPGAHPGLALLAGLFAGGIAVPPAVALRMRRLERSRS
jgi:hypothetical protein